MLQMPAPGSTATEQFMNLVASRHRNRRATDRRGSSVPRGAPVLATRSGRGGHRWPADGRTCISEGEASAVAVLAIILKRRRTKNEEQKEQADQTYESEGAGAPRRGALVRRRMPEIIIVNRET